MSPPQTVQGNFAEGPLGLLAAIGDDGRWSAGIGDPSLMGWVTVAAYVLSGLVCLWWGMAAGAERRLVPLLLGGLMLGFAVNKQLDLQSLLTQTARDLLKGTDLYEDRRTLQAIFIGVFAAGGVAVLGGMLWWCRRRLAECGVALAGLAMLVVFVAVRAASFHKVDSGLGQELSGMRLNWILELGGIGLVGVGGLLGRFQGRGRLRGTSRRIQPESGDEAPASGGHPTGDRVADLPRIARSEEPGPRPRQVMEGFVVKPIRISDGPAVRRSRHCRETEDLRDEGRGEMGPRRLVP